MSKLASQIQTDIKNYCEDMGYEYVKIIASSKKGVPDVLIIIPPMTFYFEVKTPSDTISPMQERIHRVLNATEQICFVVGSVDETREILQALIRKFGLDTNKTLTDSWYCGSVLEDIRMKGHADSYKNNKFKGEQQ